MKPLLVFIAKIRAWHVLLVAAIALIFVIAVDATDTGAFSPAVNLQLSIHSLVAIPLMIFTLAFLIFAMSTEQFRALALLPSIFIVIATFQAVAIVGSRLADPKFATPIFIILGLIVSLLFSGLLCGIIAIRRKFGR